MEDINGLRVDLPAPAFGNGINPPTLIFDDVLAGNPISEAAGFGTEAFFYLATATSGQALLTLGVEAAYGSGDPDPTSPPDQFLFARVRIRFTPAAVGTYTVTHPWGIDKIDVVAGDVGTRIDVTKDWGGFAPIPSATLPVGSSFERILYSPTAWRFLKATTVAPGVNALAWLGDGITVSTVTGGLNNVNSFTINGPATTTGIGPVLVTTNQFTVSGHVAGAPLPPPPVGVTDVVTITQVRRRNNQVQVRATSANGLTMNADLFNLDGVRVGGGSLGTIGRATFSFNRTPVSVQVRSISTNPNITGGFATAPVN